MHFEFLIRGQRLILNNRPRAVGGSMNYLTARVVFEGADWDGCEKWLHVVRDECHYEMNLVNDLITADRGLNLSAGYWIVYVIGHQIVDGEIVQRITTSKITLHLDDTGCIEEPFPSVPPSAGEQIIAQAVAARDAAAVSATAAKRSEDHAATSERGAAASAQSADAAADRARDGADEAASIANEASGHADRAERFAGLAEQQAVTHGTMYCYIDDGRLHYVKSDSIADLKLHMRDGRLKLTYGMD